MIDLSIIYYTSNHLEEKNPFFVEKTKNQLLKAADNLPIISVSQKPMNFGQNICLGDIGRSHRNIYWQILQGCKAAKTKYVAMAEDDILYSWDHFHSPELDKAYQEDRQVFLYDMAKLSIFTWSKPAMFSFRTKRRVVNQLIAPRQMLIDAMEERFKRVDELKSLGWNDEKINKYWGDPGRYEDLLGVTVRAADEYYSWVPSIVFSHEYAYGYEFNQGKRKKLGDIRIIESADWGRAEDVLKLFYK